MSATNTYVIAEAGVNHDGSMEVAERLVDEAHRAGADAVKFQVFRSSSLVTGRAVKAEYQKRTTGGEESQLAMLKRLELSLDAFTGLAARARALGIEFLATPFDVDSLRFLVELRVPRLKLGSGEITNPALLEAAARSGLPLILSTGMSTLADIESALATLAAAKLESSSHLEAFTSAEGQAWLAQTVTLLHCTTEYPAALEDVNLRAMDTLRRAFDVPVGYSDHTDGIAVPIAAVALGATVIEKHFTLDRTRVGPDHAASLEPHDLAAMVSGIRAVETALGGTHKRPTRAERANMAVARRSIVARVAIAKGEPMTREKLDFKRPGTGISPMRIDDVVGRAAPRDFAEDELIEL